MSVPHGFGGIEPFVWQSTAAQALFPGLRVARSARRRFGLDTLGQAFQNAILILIREDEDKEET